MVSFVPFEVNFSLYLPKTKLSAPQNELLPPVEGMTQAFKWCNVWQLKHPLEVSRKKSKSEGEPHHSSGLKAGVLWAGDLCCWL